MKKSLLFVALTGAALVSSCVSDEVVNVQEQQKQVRIGFSSPVLYDNAESRANKLGEITGTYSYTGSVGTYTYPREESFRIFAVNHPGDFISWDDEALVNVEFDGDSIKYDSRVDAWAPVKYEDGKKQYYHWPSGKMSFAAMSPATLGTNEENQCAQNVSYDDTGLNITDFVTPNVGEQFDLMFSKREINKTSSNMISGASAYSGIPIVFQHALTSIHFSLKVDPAVSKDVYLTKITVYNVEQKGDFKENIPANFTGVYELNETVIPTWTIKQNNLTDYVAFTGKVLFPFEAKYVSALAAEDIDNEEEDEFRNEQSHALLLLPQSFNRDYAMSEQIVQDIKIRVDYLVGDVNRYKEFLVKDYPQVEGKNRLTEWKLGTRYTYRLYYTEASEKSDMIYFAPTIEEGWIEEDIIEVRL